MAMHAMERWRASWRRIGVGGRKAWRSSVSAGDVHIAPKIVIAAIHWILASLLATPSDPCCGVLLLCLYIGCTHMLAAYVTLGATTAW